MCAGTVTPADPVAQSRRAAQPPTPNPQLATTNYQIRTGALHPPIPWYGSIHPTTNPATQPPKGFWPLEDPNIRLTAYTIERILVSCGRSSPSPAVRSPTRGPGHLGRVLG